MPGPENRWAVRPQQYRTVVLIAGILLAAIMVTGAGVRLTASGLGCEDWPGCHSDRFVPEFRFHDWIEFGNRLFSGVVGVGVSAAVLMAYIRVPRRPDLIRWAWGLVAGVIAQILLGQLTVRMDLHPLIVSSHFLLSIVLMWNVLILADKARRAPGRPRPNTDRLLGRLGRAAVAWSCVVVIAGTVVTGTGPHGGDTRADRLGFDLTTVARIHGFAAWVMLAFVVAFAIRLRRQGRRDLNRWATITLVSVLVQGAIGYIQYDQGVPAGLVALHIVGAIAVFCSVLWSHLSTFDITAEAHSSDDPILRSEVESAISTTHQRQNQ